MLLLLLINCFAKIRSACFGSVGIACINLSMKGFAMLRFHRFGTLATGSALGSNALSDKDLLLESCNTQELIIASGLYLKTLAKMILPQHVQVKVAPSDIVQDVTVIALIKSGQFQGKTERELKAWLEAILKNKCLQAYRNVTRRGEVSLEGLVAAKDDFHNGGGIQVADPSSPEPAKVYSRQELRNILRVAIMRLPVKLSLVFLMKYEEGLEVVEIAKRLGIERATAQKRYERGKERLKSMPELRRIFEGLE